MMLWVEKLRLEYLSSQYFTEEQHIANTLEQRKEIYPVKHNKTSWKEYKILYVVTEQLHWNNQDMVGQPDSWSAAKDEYKKLFRKDKVGECPLDAGAAQRYGGVLLLDKQEAVESLWIRVRVCYRQPNTWGNGQSILKATLSRLCITDPGSYRALYHHHPNICWKSITMGCKQPRFLEGVRDTGWATHRVTHSWVCYSLTRKNWSGMLWKRK